MRVKVAPVFLYGVITLAILIPFGFIFGFHRLGLLLSLILSSIVSYFVRDEILKRRRKRLSSLPVEELIRNPRVTARIDWNDLSKIEIKGSKLKFRINFNEYAAKLNRSDVQSFRELAKSKIGDRLVSR